MSASKCCEATAYATTPSSNAPPTASPQAANPSMTLPATTPRPVGKPTGLVRTATAAETTTPAVASSGTLAIPDSRGDLTTVDGGGIVEPLTGPADDHQRLWLARHWKLPLAVVMLALAFLTLRGHLPSVHAIGVAVSSANSRWVGIAALCEVLSLGMFARQQRALLSALGVRMSMLRAVLITYARSALAISMPAGSAVSAGFAFQQYKRGGATTERATAVMVLSGVVSFLGLGALYLLGILGILVVEPETTWQAHPALVAGLAGVVALCVAGWALGRRLRTRDARPARPEIGAADDTAAQTVVRRAVIATRQAVDAWRSLHVRDWMIATVFAVVNWLADMLCLAAAARAFALPVGLVTIATIYLGVQIVRQIPLTPGGIGLIETGLLAGLASAGAPTAAAAAVVLTYRVLSCWLILPLGGLAWLGLRSTPVTAPAAAASIASGG